MLLTAARNNTKIDDDNDDDSNNFIRRESVKNAKFPFKVSAVIRDTKINMIKILDNVLWVFLIYIIT